MSKLGLIGKHALRKGAVIAMIDNEPVNLNGKAFDQKLPATKTTLEGVRKIRAATQKDFRTLLEKGFGWKKHIGELDSVTVSANKATESPKQSTPSS